MSFRAPGLLRFRRLSLMSLEWSKPHQRSDPWVKDTE